MVNRTSYHRGKVMLDGNCHHLIRNMDELYNKLFKEVYRNGTTSIESGGGVED